MKTSSVSLKSGEHGVVVNGGDRSSVHIISLGAGVQSSAMALMAAHGEITPMPKCGIFADTGDEPLEVYDWLNELVGLLPFPVARLKGVSLSDSILNKWDFSQIPAWFKGKAGASIGRRQCTKYYKVLPVRREIRRQFPNQDCTLWQGISWDEVSRMKPSDRQWLTHRWPLIEMKMTRDNCLSYLAKFTKTDVPKSACVYCPYRSDKQWKESLAKPYDLSLIRKVESVLLPRSEFLHRSLQSVETTDFRRKAVTELSSDQLQLWGNECEGMCGV